jgi:hypothetical protein
VNDADWTAKGYVRDGAGWVHHSRLGDRGRGQIAELERSVRHGTMGAVQVQAEAPRNVLVRVTAFRRRLLDEDNLCEKYHVDCCRYAGVIHGDSPATTKIEVCQKKVGSKEREYVQIEIFKIG